MDSSGRRYIDFTSGIAVNALGHNHPKVVEIIRDQAGKLIHLSNLYHNEYAQGLAQMIIDSLSKDPKMDKGQVFFSNSGTEANEGAFKFARKYAKEKYPHQTGKYEVISFSNAFHGRTFAALSATPNPKYQKPFVPLMPGFKSLPFNEMSSIDAIGENACAVIIEPVQGEGGIHAASKEFLYALNRKCEQVGALLIYDEIQCGIGRTGKMFGFQSFCLPGCTPTRCETDPKSCISPDIITMAKPLAAGLPLGAVVVGPHVAACIKAGEHGTTYGGGPLATRVGQYTWNTISKPAFLKHVNDMGAIIQKRGEDLVKMSPLVKQVRGRGLLKGMELRETVPTSVFVDLCRENGVLVVSAGCNTIRLIPALIVTETEINDAFKVFEKVIAQMESLLAAGKLKIDK